jgi:hypothetical protein
MFGPYLADILDLDARDGGPGGVPSQAPAPRAFPAGGCWWPSTTRRVVGTVTFYEDAAAEGLGWPPGWAGLRALGVRPGGPPASGPGGP